MRTMSWVPIRYRDFYDVPRAIVVERGGQLYFFDCLFDRVADEYKEHFTVYRLPDDLGPMLDTMSWDSLAARGEVIGRLSVARVELDASKRASMKESVFDLL